MDFIDRKYISLLSTYVENWKQISDGLYNFRCPICGDSDKNSSKARGYIFGEKPVIYKCHNCGVSTNFASFLGDVSPSLQSEYRYEKFVAPHKKRQKRSINLDVITGKPSKLKSLRKGNLLSDYETLDVIDGDHPAKKYVEGRLIPNHKLKRINYINNCNDLMRRIPKYENRLLEKSMGAIGIPYYCEEGILRFIQLRFIQGGMRHMMLEVEPYEKIYGLDEIDWNKRVHIFEGAFDSFFVENSLAVGGVSFLHAAGFISKKARNGFTFVFDSDYRTNGAVYKNFVKAIKKGYDVVCYPQLFRYKDLNEAIMNGISVDSIPDFILKNTLSGLKAELYLKTFKKPKK